MTPFDLFEEMAGEIQDFLRDGNRHRAHPFWMLMDAYRSDDGVILQLDFPGVADGDLNVEAHHHELLISAERSLPSFAGYKSDTIERHHGKYTRRIKLNQALDTSKVDADYSSGVLTLRIPFAEQVQPHKITVTNTEKLADTSTDQ